MAYIKIYLTNLGKYNEQELVGKWVDLPCDLDAELAKIGVSNKPDRFGRVYSEYFITDYETDIPGLEIGEYSDVEELNKIADRCESLDDDELAVLGAAMDCLNLSFDDSLDVVDKGDWRIWNDCDNMTDVAKNYIAELGGIKEAVTNPSNYFDVQNYMDSHGRYEADDLSVAWVSDGSYYDESEAYDAAYAFIENEIRDLVSQGEVDDDTLDRYFDYEQYGRELESDGTFCETSEGIVEFTDY